MHELPSNFNRMLPPHKAKLTDGTLREVTCRGGEVRGIFNDTGLFYGGCGGCMEEFVYMFRDNAWITEKAFDDLLYERKGEIQKKIGSF